MHALAHLEGGVGGHGLQQLQSPLLEVGHITGHQCFQGLRCQFPQLPAQLHILSCCRGPSVKPVFSQGTFWHPVQWDTDALQEP